MDSLSPVGFSTSIESMQAQMKKQKTDADKITKAVSSLDIKSASDEEMMEACKSFEAYFTEKILKSMKETFAPPEEEEGDYMEQFGDLLYQEYAKMAADSGSIGIAKQLFESMKLQQQAVTPEELEAQKAAEASQTANPVAGQ